MIPHEDVTGESSKPFDPKHVKKLQTQSSSAEADPAPTPLPPKSDLAASGEGSDRLKQQRL